MTDTEIKLYAHPAIQGKRGEWQVGDMYYCQTCHSIDFYLDTTYRMNCPDDINCYDIIWLPREIDRENPERGLWGMVNWKRWTIYASVNGEIYLRKRGYRFQRKDERFFSGNPTEALLRAIIAQEEGTHSQSTVESILEVINP